jgi:hypothetical protein
MRNGSGPLIGYGKRCLFEDQCRRTSILRHPLGILWAISVAFGAVNNLIVPFCTVIVLMSRRNSHHYPGWHRPRLPYNSPTSLSREHYHSWYSSAHPAHPGRRWVKQPHDRCQRRIPSRRHFPSSGRGNHSTGQVITSRRWWYHCLLVTSALLQCSPRWIAWRSAMWLLLSHFAHHGNPNKVCHINIRPELQ